MPDESSHDRAHGQASCCRIMQCTNTRLQLAIYTQSTNKGRTQRASALPCQRGVEEAKDAASTKDDIMRGGLSYVLLEIKLGFPTGRAGLSRPATL